MKNDLDILLIHPNAARKVYQGLSDNFSAIEPPIWACMMASYLRNKGWNVDILDSEALKLDVHEIVNKAKSLAPRLIGMVVYGQQPSASTQNMCSAVEIMSELSILDIPKIYIGPHPSALPYNTVLNDKKSFVCQGEGLLTLDKLLRKKDLKDIFSLYDIPGLWYFDDINNKICNNPPAALIQNLDNEIPNLSLDLLPLEKYRTTNWHSWTNNNNTQPFFSIYTSLGCPFKCSFCMINAPFNNGNHNNNTFRFWSPEHSVKIMEQFADLGIVNIKIADEMFVLKPNHFMSICDLITKRGYKFNMWAYSRIDTIKDIYLSKLKSAGINWLGLGIESASAEIRQDITKGKFNTFNIKQIVGLIEQHNICSVGNFIFGLPNDNLITMNQTLQLALDLPIDYANFYCAMAYPGSRLHQEFSQISPHFLPENNNIGWIGYSQHAYETFNLPSSFLKNSEILKFRDDAFNKFFTNNEYITRMVKKFGSSFEKEIFNMMQVKLKRKLYE